MLKKELSPEKSKYKQLELPKSPNSLSKRAFRLPFREIEEESYSDDYYEYESADEEEIKLRAIIERQKAAKLLAETDLNDNKVHDSNLFSITSIQNKKNKIQNSNSM